MPEPCLLQPRFRAAGSQPDVDPGCASILQRGAGCYPMTTESGHQFWAPQRLAELDFYTILYDTTLYYARIYQNVAQSDILYDLLQSSTIYCEPAFSEHCCFHSGVRRARERAKAVDSRFIKGGAVETGCSDLYDIICQFTIQYYPHPLHPPPTTPPFAECRLMHTMSRTGEPANIRRARPAEPALALSLLLLIIVELVVLVVLVLVLVLLLS